MDALHIFGCGVDVKKFEAKFNTLDQVNQERIELVARRIWLTLKLRYEANVFRAPFESSEERMALNLYELPAIEIYLLVTCLDTLAGQPTHVDFRDWLRAQSGITNLTVEQVIHLYKNYNDKYGVSKNLRALFDNLPQCTKDWLSHNVAVYEIDQHLPSKDQDPNLLVKLLYTYFYGIRRNEYTHRSSPKQVSTAESVFLGETGFWVTPASGTHFVLDSRKPNKKWNFSYRQGLDEATILRVIIHSVAVQTLNIDVTEQLILLNLKNFSRLDGFYSIMSEFTTNANTLRFWSNVEELAKSDYRNYLTFVGIPSLSNQASSRMLDRYQLDHSWEKTYSYLTSRYIDEINQINKLITEFNQKNPHAKPNQGNIKAHWEAIQDFLARLLETPLAKSILRLPTTNEVTNLWLIIRDPCHIGSVAYRRW